MKSYTKISVEEFIFCEQYNRNCVFYEDRITENDKKRYEELKGT